MGSYEVRYFDLGISSALQRLHFRSAQPQGTPRTTIQLGKSNNNKNHVSNSHAENAAEPAFWLAGYKTIV